MVKNCCGGRIKRKSIKWGGILLVFVIAMGATVGIWGMKPTRALPGSPSDWTVTNESGLTLTVVSVEQYGVEIAPVWNDYIFNYDTYDFGDYYFPTANNSDNVRVGVRVDGMADGESYVVFDDEDVTAADNGEVFYIETEPHVYGYGMRDSTECWMEQDGEHCSVTPLANEYTIEAAIRKRDWSDRVSRDLIFRPTIIGSTNIEIVSVKQNGTDLPLDTVGRQVNTWDAMQETLQTINEYRIDDYSAPVEVKFKLKHLEVGRNYSISVGNDYDSFKADATEKTETRELNLNFVEKHLDAEITLFESGSYYTSESVPLYFRIADANFVPLGDIIIDEVDQNGNKIEPTSNVTSYSREYTFSANDVQPISIRLHATRATADLDYYISYNMNGVNNYLSGREPIVVSGFDLENGAVLTIPSGYGLSESSPMTLSISVNTLGRNMYSSQMIFYENYGPSRYNSDEIKINYYEDNNLPRFTASCWYTANDEEVADRVNAKYHDADHPLRIRIEGERYQNGRTYEILAKVATGDGTIYDNTFTATGAELNGGVEFVLDGLVLSLPVFDPTGSTSGYEMSYDFSLEIDGLELSGSLVYMYDGWIYTVMTYAGGQVAASGNNGGGMGGAMYMTSSTVTVKRSSLDGSRSAVLHYLGSGFDEDLTFDYAIYYNGNAGDAWWSAAAGTEVRHGTITGQALNNDGLSVEVAVPDGASESSMYSLVITKNGGLVIVSKDFLMFTDDPMIEAFTFHADDDSFMQTGRQSYRLARGAEATATLTGAGFEPAQEYRIWVTYSGYHYDEYGYYDDVDLTQLDNDIIVTGAQLNAGYDYEMAYDLAMDAAETVEVMFNVTDKNSERPEPYAETGNGVYDGHGIYIDYVAEEDVFRADDGFQIDTDTGEIIDVAQPDHHGDLVDNRTHGIAGTHVEENTLTLVADKPCVVIGSNNGDLSVIAAATTRDDDGTRTNTYNIEGFDGVVVALKGDGDFDGAVTTADSNLINRSLISPSLRPYRGLSGLESVVFDVDGDHVVTTADSNLINRSLISNSLRPYKALEW